MTRTTALFAASALIASGLVAVAPAASAAPVTITDAALRWGVNGETNSAAFAPGTWNLLSAGKVKDPGAGGQTLRTADSGATWSNGNPAGWTNTAGAVGVEDEQPGGGHVPSGFEGTRRDAAGTLGTTGNGVQAGTQLVFRDGTGSLDPAAGTADIAWSGDATVLYYSGLTFFYVSNPRLTVAGGSGTVTATLSGFGSSMADPSVWTTLVPKQVTLATLTGVTVTAAGLTVTPDYRGVAYPAPAGGTEQVRTGADWGSFPKSFVDFQVQTGQASYWYSSGGAADKRKPAAPLQLQADAPAAAALTAPATVSARYGTATAVPVAVSGSAPTGSVSLVEGFRVLSSATLAGGKATLPLPAVTSVGSHALTVRYRGDAANGAAYRGLTATVAPGTLAAPTPTVVGTARVGSVQTARPGTWTAGTALTYQWRRNGVAISRATATSYRAVAADAGRKVTVTVTGRTANYTTVARTSAARTIAAGALTAAAPRIGGKARVGKKLTAAVGSWRPGPVALRYQWRASGKTVKGGTGRTLKLTKKLRGKKLTVTVTGVKSGYRTLIRTSRATAKIR